MHRIQRVVVSTLLVALAVSCAAGDPRADAPGSGDVADPGSSWTPAPVDLRALLESGGERFADVLERGDEHRLKVELALVDGSVDPPRLVRSSLDLGPEYFYPASSVKTCAAIAALIHVRELARGTGAPVGPDSPLRYHPLFEGEVTMDRDPSHIDGGAITLAHEAAKVFLVSDNEAYNRLYEFAGVDEIRERMRGAGLASCRVVHRLSEFRSPEDQLRLPAIDVLSARGGDVLLRIPERTGAAPDTNAGMSGVVFGVGHVRGGEVVGGPMDFTRKNFMSLRDLLDMNVMLLRPDVAVEGGAGFDLHPDDRAEIFRRMAQTPGASVDPAYDAAEYPDDHSKFLAPGLWRMRGRDEIRILDKVGRAYGFSVTNSYVRDARTGRAFFLAATLYTNDNGVVGDGVYEYGRADRFLGDLGEAVGRAVFGE